MRTTRALQLGAAALLCAAVSTGAVASHEHSHGEHLRSFTGKAYASDSGALLYSEHHQQRWVDGKLVSAQVSYTLPDGKVLADKTLDFSRRPYAPDFRTENHITGEMEAGQLQADHYRVWYREKTGAPIKSGTVKLSPDLITDAGFDGYVIAHLPALRAGKKVKFRFLVPSRLSTYDFNASLAARKQVLGRAALLIRVDMDSLLLRLLTQPFKVAYDAHTGELLTYDGLSNLGDANGKYKVHIVYPNGQLGRDETAPQ